MLLDPFYPPFVLFSPQLAFSPDYTMLRRDSKRSVKVSIICFWFSGFKVYSSTPFCCLSSSSQGWGSKAMVARKGRELARISMMAFLNGSEYDLIFAQISSTLPYTAHTPCGCQTPTRASVK